MPPTIEVVQVASAIYNTYIGPVHTAPPETRGVVLPDGTRVFAANTSDVGLAFYASYDGGITWQQLNVVNAPSFPVSYGFEFKADPNGGLHLGYKRYVSPYRTVCYAYGTISGDTITWEDEFHVTTQDWTDWYEIRFVPALNSDGTITVFFVYESYWDTADDHDLYHNYVYVDPTQSPVVYTRAYADMGAYFKTYSDSNPPGIFTCIWDGADRIYVLHSSYTGYGFVRILTRNVDDPRTFSMGSDLTFAEGTNEVSGEAGFAALGSDGTLHIAWYSSVAPKGLRYRTYKVGVGFSSVETVDSVEFASVPALLLYDDTPYVVRVVPDTAVGNQTGYDEIQVRERVGVNNWSQVGTAITIDTSVFMSTSGVMTCPHHNINPITAQTALRPVQYYWDLYDIRLSFNTAPTPPTHLHISGSGYTINPRPTLFFQVSDPDGDQITDVHVQVATDSGFASLVFDGTASGVPAQFTGVPVNSGGTVIWTPASDLPVGTLYLRVKAQDANGDWSDWSTTQQFTVASPPWSDTVQDNLPSIKATWLNDIATVINAARQFRGLSMVSFTDGTLQAGVHDCRAIYFTERRQKLTDVLNIVGVTPTWETPTLDDTVDRTGRLINELRKYCSQT